MSEETKNETVLGGPLEMLAKYRDQHNTPREDKDEEEFRQYILQWVAEFKAMPLEDQLELLFTGTVAMSKTIGVHEEKLSVVQAVKMGLKAIANGDVEPTIN